MSDVPLELVVALFRDKQAADQALKALKQVRREGLIGISNAAMLVKNQGGKLRIKKIGAISGRKGSVMKLIAELALVAPATVGALIGGLSAKLPDSDLHDADLRQIGDGLKPGSSAIIAMVERRSIPQVHLAMTCAVGDVLVIALHDEPARQFDAGPDLVYSVLTTQEGYVLFMTAANEKPREGGMFVVGEDKVRGWRYIAPEEGFAVMALQADETGAAVVGIESKRAGETGAQPNALPETPLSSEHVDQPECRPARGTLPDDAGSQD